MHSAINVATDTIAQNNLTEFSTISSMFMKNIQHKRNLSLIILGILLCNLARLAVAANELPEFGDTSSGIVSISQERVLGDQVMQQLRHSSIRYRDPEVQNYTELLLFKMAQASQLKDRNLRLTLINDPTINAFAVPGSVIGIHLGLFLEGATESEFAAVLAHEIAHLAQRHYARGTETEKRSALPLLAGLLGSMVLLSQAGTDAGLAALYATQASSIAKKLSYSRELEREADRVGIQTLHGAGLNPEGMANMFIRMHRNSGGSTPLEFLLTHPLSQSRIADARGQTAQYPKKTHPKSLNYQLMRAKVSMLYKDADVAKDYYRKELKQAIDKVTRSASRYGLALALIKDKELAEAQELITQLLKNDTRLTYWLLQAELWLVANQPDLAIARLERLLKIHTDNKSIAYVYVKALIKAEKFDQAKRTLKRQTRLYPDDVDLWFDLAEVSGLAEDILGVHKARTEFYLLRGQTKEAIQQLRSAIRLTPENSGTRSRLQHQLDEVIKKDAG